jgi:hypothetical protein
MRTTQTTAACFRDLDFHDDTFVGLSILPAQAHGDISGSVIEISLSSHQNQVKRVLQFIGCANLRVALDFDVLASNLPPNTSGVDAHVDENLMREFMQSQKHDWGVGYGKMRSPLNAKLDAIDALVYFRIQFFGGVVEILAKEFLIEGGSV